MRDDWYHDCLQYDDLFKNTPHVQMTIQSLLEEWDGCYSGDKSFVRDIPKKGYGERYGLETDFYDRFLYQAICSFLIPYYDPLISHRVLSYRYDTFKRKEKYLFKPKIDKWLTFEGVTLTFARSGKFLLVTDLSNFFENIGRKQLIRSLMSQIVDINASGAEKLQIRNAIGVLDRLLQQWTFSGDHGLPQNRDASSFLSNVLLTSVDKCMVDRGHDYYRYVDDIRVIADTEIDARRALQDLIRELRKAGMNINGAKTDILSPDADAKEIAKHFPSKDSRSTAISNMWRSRSRRIISKSVQFIVQMMQECISTNDTQSRQFRFAVGRLSQIIDSGLFNVDGDLISSLMDILISSLAANAATTDQYCRLISIIDKQGSCLPKIATFLVNEKAAIHDWQNYNLWLLLASRNFKTEELISLAKIKLSETLTSGEAAAILIWLRCVDEPEILSGVIAQYDPKWPSQNIRYLLLSTANLAPDTLKPLHGRVPIKHLGTATRSRQFENEKGMPFAVREPTDFYGLINEVSEYD